MSSYPEPIDLSTIVKPCKCGAKPKIIPDAGWYYVQCPKCHQRYNGDFPSPFDAVGAWNCNVEERVKGSLTNEERRAIYKLTKKR